MSCSTRSGQEPMTPSLYTPSPDFPVGWAWSWPGCALSSRKSGTQNWRGSAAGPRRCPEPSVRHPFTSVPLLGLHAQGAHSPLCPIPRAPDLPFPDSLKPLPATHCPLPSSPRWQRALAKKLGLEQQLVEK